MRDWIAPALKARRVVRTCTEYEKSPGAYHRARRALFTELDRLTKPSSG